MSETRYCSTCGALLSASAALCGECGARYQASPYERRATDAPGAWSQAPKRASRDLEGQGEQEKDDTGVQLISAADLEPERPGATTMRPQGQYDQTMTTQHSAPSAAENSWSAASATGHDPEPSAADGSSLPYPVDHCVPASFGKRAAAAVIDSVILSLVSLPMMIGLTLLLVQDPPGLLAQIMVGIGVALPAAVAVLLIWLQGAKGFYPGKLIMGLRVTRLAEGGGIGFLRSAGRWFLYGAIPWLMALSVFLDPKKTLRGFHDRIVDSVVVDIKAGANPMLPRPDDFERPGAEHYLGQSKVEVSTDDNLMAAPGSPWSAQSAEAAPASQPAVDPWAPAAAAGAAGGAAAGAEQPSTASVQEPAPSPYAPPSAPSPYAPPAAGSAQEAPAAPAADWSHPSASEPGMQQEWQQPPAAQDWQHAPSAPQEQASPPAAEAPAPAPTSDEQWRPDGQVTVGPIDDHEVDEETRVVAPPALEEDDEDLEQTRISPRRLRVPRLVLTLDDGTSRTVETAVAIGRNPAQDAAPTRFAITDETRSVSKSHVIIDGTGETVTVTDLGSTNGTAIVHRDGRRDVLVPQTRTDLPEGASLAIGDRTLTVEREA